jgi:hypothetical protein
MKVDVACYQVAHARDPLERGGMEDVRANDFRRAQRRDDQ